MAAPLASGSREGWEGALVIATDGRAGTADPDTKPEDLIRTREAEATAAAKVLGIEDVTFLGYPDGELEDTRELREHLVREIRRFRPEVVFTFDPNRRGHNHRASSERGAGGVRRNVSVCARRASFPAPGSAGLRAAHRL